jgi:hypothetical protein
MVTLCPARRSGKRGGTWTYTVGVSCPVPLSRPLSVVFLDNGSLRLGEPNELDPRPEWRTVDDIVACFLYFLAASQTGGGYNAKAHDDFDRGGTLAGHDGHASQRAKPAARRRPHLRAQERYPDRYAGGV